MLFLSIVGLLAAATLAVCFWRILSKPGVAAAIAKSWEVITHGAAVGAVILATVISFAYQLADTLRPVPADTPSIVKPCPCDGKLPCPCPPPCPCQK